MTDIDECEFDNGGCSQLCHNTEGSFHCTCHRGFQIGNDAVSCFSNYFSYHWSISQCSGVSTTQNSLQISPAMIEHVHIVSCWSVTSDNHVFQVILSTDLCVLIIVDNVTCLIDDGELDTPTAPTDTRTTAPTDSRTTAPTDTRTTAPSNIDNYVGTPSTKGAPENFFTAQSHYTSAVLVIVIWSVLPSVHLTRMCFMVKPTNILPILWYHESVIILVFWHQQTLVGDVYFHLTFALKLTHPH